jgi:radical SAM superfamily enzyme YgiQ (UPF0313 family)
MKVTFILLHITPWRTTQYYSGIASLSAVLKQEGHEVSLLHYTRPVKERELIADLSSRSPDLIGFSATTHMFLYAAQWAPWIKKHFDIPVICGGAHPTIAPQEVIRTSGIDMICIGEGEVAMAELCRSLENRQDITRIPGIWIKDGDTVIKNPVGPLIEDLDSLPREDRGIFDYNMLYSSLNNTVDFMASRGCPYSCSYCCIPVIKKIYPNPGKYVRFRSVDSVIEEIKEIAARYSFTKFVRFFDDILPLNRDWFGEFASKYREEVGLPFSCQWRADLIDRETAGLLKTAGCYIIRFGVESGNDRIRNDVLNRGIAREQIIRAFALCRESGIKARANYIIGSPFEDMRSVLDSVKLNAEIRPDETLAAYFYPYTGSQAHLICEENGFLTGIEHDTFQEAPFISQKTITWNQVRFAYETFLYFVRLYRWAEKLPRRVKAGGVKALDSFYCSKMKPHGLIAGALRLRKRISDRTAEIIKKRAPGIYSKLRSGRGTRV